MIKKEYSDLGRIEKDLISFYQSQKKGFYRFEPYADDFYENTKKYLTSLKGIQIQDLVISYASSMSFADRLSNSSIIKYIVVVISYAYIMTGDEIKKDYYVFYPDVIKKDTGGSNIFYETIYVRK